jgi:hypothetical protein
VTITVQLSDGTTLTSTSFEISVGVRINLPLLYKLFAICDLTQTDCTEPNNLPTTAAGPLNINTVYTGTVNGVDDRYDYYTITLNADISYTFRLDFAAGDLDIYLYGSSSNSPPLAQSAKPTRPEVFEYRARVTAIYYIQIYGFENTVTNRRYTLQVRQTSSRTGVAAASEGSEVTDESWYEPTLEGPPDADETPRPVPPFPIEEPTPQPTELAPVEEPVAAPTEVPTEVPVEVLTESPQPNPPP